MDTRFTFLPGSSAFSLPGAWPSADSLEETLSLPNANPRNEEPWCTFPDISCSEWIKPRSAAGERSSRNSVATYGDDSDDFYSFVEDQEDDDVEVASSLDDMVVPIKVEDSGSMISENPGTTSTTSNPALEHTEHTTSSDDTSSSQKMSVSSAPSYEPNFMPQSDYDHPYSRPTLTPSTKCSGPTPRTSLVTSSSRSVNSESSFGSGSARLGDEEFSHHLGYSEDESAVSHAQVYNIIDEVHFSNISDENHVSSSPPRVRRSLRIQRRVIVNQDSQLNTLQLVQPDGHNPWTLSLDPGLVNLSDFATSSRTSVSVESSSLAHVSPSVSLESRLQTPDSPQTPTAPQSFSVAQNALKLRVGLDRPSADLLPSHYAAPSSYSGFTEKRDVMQKPKTFYQKMKRFFTPKSSKRNESKGISNEMSTTTPINAGFTLLPFPSPYASSQWSLNRQAFQRSAKSSAPSVALSCTPDIPYNSYRPPAGMTQETRRTFEHLRPLTPEVVKSRNKRNRRFSVPTPFNASLAPSAPSSSRNISAPSSRPFVKRWSRVGESEH